MFGLTTLGIIHTALSLVAVVSGFCALARDKQISPQDSLGRTYLITTLFTALTALAIFQHGGFGPGHAMAIATLLALAVGTVAAGTGLFGAWASYVQAISYSATLLLHLIAGFTESLTRLPLGQPILPNAESPAFGPIYGVLLLAFVVGLVLQLRWLRAEAAKP
jgi:uncharacterized membrane protein